MVHVNGVKSSLYPTIQINTNKAKGQLPQILRYDKEENQNDEETDLGINDPTALAIYTLPLLNHPPLVSQQDLAKEDPWQSSD